MKAMISQPMANKTDAEIKATREKAVKKLNSLGYDVIDTFFTDEWHNAKDERITNIPIHFLAKSLDRMSLCNAVYFCEGWESARGCKIEHDVAEAYGLTIIICEK